MEFITRLRHSWDFLSQSKNKLELFDARNARGSMNGALFSSLSSWREKNWTVHGFINTQSYCHGFFLVSPPAKCAFTFGIGKRFSYFFCLETFLKKHMGFKSFFPPRKIIPKAFLQFFAVLVGYASCSEELLAQMLF